MLAQMKGGGMDGAVPRLPAKRGFSPLLSPGVPESQLDAVGGISGEWLSAGGQDLYKKLNGLTKKLWEEHGMDSVLDSASAGAEKSLVPLQKGLMPLKSGCWHFNEI